MNTFVLRNKRMVSGRGRLWASFLADHNPATDDAQNGNDRHRDQSTDSALDLSAGEYREDLR